MTQTRVPGPQDGLGAVMAAVAALALLAARRAIRTARLGQAT